MIDSGSRVADSIWEEEIVLKRVGKHTTEEQMLSLGVEVVAEATTASRSSSTSSRSRGTVVAMHYYGSLGFPLLCHSGQLSRGACWLRPSRAPRTVPNRGVTAGCDWLPGPAAATGALGAETAGDVYGYSGVGKRQSAGGRRGATSTTGGPVGWLYPPCFF